MFKDLPWNRINNNREKDATIRKLQEEVAKLTQEQQQGKSPESTPNTRSGAKRRQNKSDQTASKVARVTRSRTETVQATPVVESPPMSVPTSTGSSRRVRIPMSFRFLITLFMSHLHNGQLLHQYFSSKLLHKTKYEIWAYTRYSITIVSADETIIQSFDVPDDDDDEDGDCVLINTVSP